MTTLEYALQYRDLGLSVIPVSADKRPLIKWEEYQSRIASVDEIKDWYTRTPNANVGIVTGKISNLTVLDCDSPKAVETFRSYYKNDTVTVKTPRGVHYYFKYAEGTRNTVKIKGLDLDLRSEGGYVVAPPSLNGDGIGYKFVKDFSVGLDSFRLPEEIIIHPQSYPRQLQTNYFTEGRRDEDLFHVANSLVKGNCDQAMIYTVLQSLAARCIPPFPEKEIEAKIQSALERALRRERNISREVENFVMLQTGYFSVASCYNEIQLVTKEQKTAARVHFHRLLEKGIIEKYGNRSGEYQKPVVNTSELLDFINAPTEPFDIKLPLGLNDKTAIFPKSIIVIAGVTGQGKTALTLNLIMDNMHKHDINYLVSEASDVSMREQLDLFNYPLKDWRMKVYSMTRDFHTRVLPDGITVIDYLTDYDAFYNIPNHIDKIFEKLHKGVAVILLQKKAGSDYGRSGELGAERATLYISLEWQVLKVQKNRFRHRDKFRGLDYRNYDIRNGLAVPLSGWYNDSPTSNKKNKNKELFAGDPDFPHEE